MRRELVADWEKLFTVNQPFEEENVRLGRLFNTLMVISSGVALSIAIALLLMIPLGHVAPHLALIATAFPILFVPVSVLCVILSRRGHTKFSIKLYVWLNCIAICLATYLFDGVNSPAWYIFLWTITISGILLTPGHSLGMAGGVLAYFILLGSLTSFGVYTPPLTFGNQQREELDVIFLLLMLVSTGGLLTYLNMRSLRKSFEFLHTEIIEHRQAEEESRRLKDEWERTFHAVPDLITILDQDYKILRTNAALDKRLDLPPNTCIGQKCYSLIDGLEAPLDNCPHTQLLRDGLQHSAEISIDRLEGTFEITDTPLYDESGKLVGSVHIARDITSRKQAEADLRASETRYRTLVETSPNGIMMTDQEGKLLFCNSLAARTFGYDSPQAMYGMNVLELISPAEHASLAQNTQKLLEEGNIKNAEYLMVRKNGSRFPAEANASIFREVDNNITYIISIIRDISDRKQAMEKEKRLIELKEEFIASVSHDLRTPLFSLMGYLDLLQKGKVADIKVQNEFLSRASDDVNRLLDIVNELLDISRLETSGLVLNKKRADLGPVITKVVSSFVEQAKARHITLSSPSEVPIMLAELDLPRVRRVLTNLVENALKFSDPGGQVIVTGEKKDGKIVIQVADNGCGISAEDCPKVFDKFYQANDKHKRNNAGRGLGLYISKQIIDAHGGTINVESQLGFGSKFTFTLPM